MARLLAILLGVAVIIATMLIVKGAIILKTRKVRCYHDMLVRTAEGEHETELLPHLDPNVAKLCPVCNPVSKALKSTYDPNQSLQERIEKSFNDHLGVTVGFSHGNAVLYDQAQDAFRLRAGVPEPILYHQEPRFLRDHGECGYMGCGSPQCDKVCAPEPVVQSISVGECNLHNEKYKYDHALGLLREQRLSEESVINLREKETLITNAIGLSPLFPMTPNERRETQGLTDYDLDVLEERGNLYHALHALDQKGYLTPEERDREERRLLALRHDL